MMGGINALNPSSDALRQSAALKTGKNRVIFLLVSKDFSGVNLLRLSHLLLLDRSASALAKKAGSAPWRAPAPRCFGARGAFTNSG